LENRRLLGLPVPGQATVSGKSYLTLTFTDQAALTDIACTVQVSSDLQNWQSGAAYTVRTDNGTTNTAVFRDLTAIGSTPQRFMRLSVTRQ
jgi:hypothetical protein